MKLRLLCVFLFFISFSCTHQTELSKKDQWNIRWTADEVKTEGLIFLSENNTARIIIENPDYVLFSQKEDVNYHYHLTDHQLTLIRKDNDVVLNYQILEKSSNFIKLSYAGDFIIEIYR